MHARFQGLAGWCHAPEAWQSPSSDGAGADAGGVVRRGSDDGGVGAVGVRDRCRDHVASDLDLRVLGHGPVSVDRDASGDVVPVVDQRPGPVVATWVRATGAGSGGHAGARIVRIRVAELAAEPAASVPARGIEFVLPSGERVGVVAEGVRRLAGEPAEGQP